MGWRDDSMPLMAMKLCVCERVHCMQDGWVRALARGCNLPCSKPAQPFLRTLGLRDWQSDVLWLLSCSRCATLRHPSQHQCSTQQGHLVSSPYLQRHSADAGATSGVLHSCTATGDGHP